MTENYSTHYKPEVIENEPEIVLRTNFCAGSTNQDDLDFIKEQQKKRVVEYSVKQKESRIIYQIANELFKKHFLFTTSISSIQIDRYKIIRGKKYEILSVDFRVDGNYVFMREFNENTELLFGGNEEDIFNYDIGSQNVFEFLRRGYINNDEDIAKEIETVQKQYIREQSHYKEFHKELAKKFKIEKIEDTSETYEEKCERIYKGVIEIEISQFVRYFDDIEINGTDDTISIYDSYDSWFPWLSWFFIFNETNKCKLCHFNLDTACEKVKISCEEEMYCHRSCYQYAKCCRCKTKRIFVRSDLVQIDHLSYFSDMRAVICIYCSRFRRFDYSTRSDNDTNSRRWRNDSTLLMLKLEQYRKARSESK